MSIIEDQRGTIAFLADPRTHGGASARRIDTHGAVVFLAGDRAYKLKRAVRFCYMDFSTVERRRAMCEAELAINRRTAPQIYRAAWPVVRQSDGSLALRGVGDAVDWVVVMSRFDEDGLFDRLAERGRLTDAYVDLLAREIVRFHRAAAV